MSQLPTPPWRVRLRGRDPDLVDLANCLQRNDVRVVQDGKWFFLEADLLNEIRDPELVYPEARQLLRLVSGIARIRRSDALPVKPWAVEWKASSGIWHQMILLSDTQKFIVCDGVVRLTETGVFANSLALALRDATVAEVVGDFLGEWSFSQLRRVAETIKLDIGAGDSKRGVREIVTRGWASDAELERFHDTVNFGDRSAPGAHSRMRRGHGSSPMNIIEAGEFLRSILARWVESKA